MKIKVGKTYNDGLGNAWTVQCVLTKDWGDAWVKGEFFAIDDNGSGGVFSESGFRQGVFEESPNTRLLPNKVKKEIWVAISPKGKVYDARPTEEAIKKAFPNAVHCQRIEYSVEE